MISRVPGQGRYARVEREQRWLLGAVPDGVGEPVQIVDRYLRGTNLRLRRVESRSEVVCKLGQKVRERLESPETVRMTNIYVTEREYSVLAGLDGAILRKTRRPWTVAGRRLSVDEFHDALAGLVLAEVELAVEEARLPPPPWAVADVTEDDRFSGGALASLTRGGARRLLDDVAILKGRQRSS